MIKLLYDISLLGIGYRNRSISGLMRTAEQLLFSLSELKVLDINFCSSLSFEVWRYCRQYLQQHPTHSRHSLLPSEIARHNIYLKLAPPGGYPEQPAFKPAAIAEKVLRRLFELQFKPLGRSDLAEIDIYHSPYHAVPRMVRQTVGIRRFLTVHDIIPVRYPHYFGLKKNFRSADFDREFNLLQSLQSIDPDTWVICPSRATLDDLGNYLNRRIDPDKTAVIPWAAADHFHPCRDATVMDAVKLKYGIPRGPYILSLGTLEPRKNIVHLIRSFAQLVAQENLPDLSLVLAGAAGWDYGSIFEELTRYPQLKQRIIFTGYVADEDLSPLYSGALVFVYPSFYEGFGLPPLEAMQCGTPVITSNTSSLPEVVGGAGIMLNPSDHEGLCQQMLAIYRSSALREELSARSLEQARKFSWTACARQTAAAYRKALY